MAEVGGELARAKSHVKAVQDMMSAFTIHAPAGGMVTYVREWNGKKREVGSQVSPWGSESAIAMLPDLSKMETITYVDELDVRQGAVGQPVTITLDADLTQQLARSATD